MLIKNIIGLVLLSTAALHADDGLIAARARSELPYKQRRASEPVKRSEPSFFIHADYLFWKPYVDGLEFCAFGGNGSSLSLTNITMKIQQPDFHWGSGGRLQLGGYLDKWDFSVIGTYMPGSGSKKKTAHFMTPPNNSFLTSIYQSNYMGVGSKVKAHWDIEYFTGDVVLGRSIFLNPKVEIHPFLGARYVVVNQDLKIKYISNFNTVVVPTTNTMDFDMWGIGPRVGLDFGFWIHRRWEFLAGASGSIVYGNYHSKLKTNGFNIESNPFLMEVERFETKRSHQAIRTNLEGFVGVGYKRQWKNSLKAFRLKAQVEAATWFDLNTNADFIFAGDINQGTLLSFYIPRKGNLSFLGLTVDVGLDF